VPIFPELKKPVMQLSSMLNDEQSGEIEQKIIQIEETTGSQIAIIILSTTKPFEIEEYSIQLAKKWKLGRKGVDDGILIAVSMGIFFARKNWNVLGFILPGLYLTVLLLIGQFFISSYFSEGYYIFFPASIGYAIIYLIVNFRKIDEKYGSVKSISTSSSNIDSIL
jgi:hypothetical protein